MLPYFFLKYQLTKHKNAFIQFLFRPQKIDKELILVKFGPHKIEES